MCAGCSSSSARARSALSAYQSATAANDPEAARRALLELVQAKDDVPDYWIELGKVAAATGHLDQAYYAFTRAYELDRSNVDVVRGATQLALRVGDLPAALKHAEELEVLSPGDPLPKLTKGWAATRESRFDEAVAAADAILANSPYDSDATLLKARSLLGMSRTDDAKALLVKQTQAQPSDIGSLELLAGIYRREGDWAQLLNAGLNLTQLAPQDQKHGLMVVEAGLRAGKVEIARTMSQRLLGANAEPALVRSVLELWDYYWPSPQRVTDARALAAKTLRESSLLVYANFLNRFGSPQDAVRLSLPAATLPVQAKSSEANAVLGDALARLGKTGDAKARLDAVLAFDPGNPTALRARAELELRSGQTKAAIVDAEKLTTVLPTSAPDRLLLARTYAAAGNTAWVDRTLWSAFQDIPSNEQLFAALDARRRGDADAQHQLQEEYDHQRDTALARGGM